MHDTIRIMLTIGVEPLLQRSLSQHLYSHVVPLAVLQAFKKPVSAASHCCLLLQLFVNDVVDARPTVKFTPVVTQRSKPSPQSVSF